MSWLSDLVGPRLRDIVGADREVAEAAECLGCRVELSPDVFRAGLGVCPHCGQLNPLGPEERFAALFDDGRCEEVADQEITSDPLRFRDARRYADRLKDTQARVTGRDSLAVARGTVGGADVVAACVDHAFLDGTIGVQAGAALAQAARLAAIQRVPLIIFTGPSGLRAQEGLLPAAQACRVLPALRELWKVGMPTITVLAAGHGEGDAPLIAAFADIVIREGEPRRPQAVDATASTGAAMRACDLVVPRSEIAEVLRHLVDLATNRRPPAPVVSLHPNGAEPRALDDAAAH